MTTGGRSPRSRPARRSRSGDGAAGGAGPARSARRTSAPDSWNASDVRDYARNRLIQSRLTPNAISLTGFALNVVAAALVLYEQFVLGGLAFIVGSIMDTLDGRYSRMSGKGTAFGAFLDSTLDRVEEGIVLTAVAAWFSRQGDELAAAAVVIVVIGSFMVSYTRARAEALGIECKVGVATRPVRVVLLSIGLVFARGAGLLPVELLEPVIYVLAAMTTFTVLQRVFHVRAQLAAADAV